MKLSKKMKTQIKKRLTSATAILAVLVLVFACSKITTYKVETNTANVINSDSAAKNEIGIIKDSTGINLHITGVDDSSVNAIEVYQGTTKIKDFSYNDNSKVKEEDFKISIPFGETHQITVMVNGEAAAQKDVQNMRYIATAQDMVNFRNIVNNGKTFEGEYVELLNNIDMSAVCSASKGTWTPIGLNSTKSFKGTFQRKLLPNSEFVRKHNCR